MASARSVVEMSISFVPIGVELVREETAQEGGEVQGEVKRRGVAARTGGAAREDAAVASPASPAEGPCTVLRVRSLIANGTAAHAGVVGAWRSAGSTATWPLR